MQGKEFRILIIDRNPNVREFLKREFSRGRFSARTAKDAAEGLAVLASGEPVDLIVLDPDSAGAGGAAFVRRLVRERAGLPVVLHVLGGEEAAVADCGAAAVVEKSGDPARLLAVAGGILRERRPAAV